MIFDDVQEVSNNVIWRIRTVNKEKIVVSDILVLECLLVVLLFVESKHTVHSYVLKNAAVLVGMMAVLVSSVTLLNGSHECHKLSGNDPVEISVFNLLVVLILFDVESFEVVPTESYGVLETLQTVSQGAVVEAVTLRGVSVGLEVWEVRLELLKNLVR